MEQGRKAWYQNLFVRRIRKQDKGNERWDSAEGRKKRFVDSVPAICVLGLGVEPARAEIESLCAQRMKR